MKISVAVLIPLALFGCVVSPAPTKEPTSISWVGGYTKSNYLYGAELRLEEDGTFHFVKRTSRGFPEGASGKWLESANMIHLASWGIVEPYRFLNKIVLDGERYLLPVGHDQFLYDQVGSTLKYSFFGGAADRRMELGLLEFYEALNAEGFTE